MLKKKKNSNGKSQQKGPAPYLLSPRGVKDWKQATEWLAWRGIEDIECITPDQAGIARGKMMPAKKFISNTSLALPSAVFLTTISGEYPEDGHGFVYPEDDGDLKLVPDLNTLAVVPWGALPGWADQPAVVTRSTYDVGVPSIEVLVCSRATV